jgi:hypothetical protein
MNLPPESNSSSDGNLSAMLSAGYWLSLVSCDANRDSWSFWLMLLKVDGKRVSATGLAELSSSSKNTRQPDYSLSLINLQDFRFAVQYGMQLNLNYW